MSDKVEMGLRQFQPRDEDRACQDWVLLLN